MLAAIGADRCMRRKVERNGAETCASVVKMDDAVTAGFPLLDTGETGPFVVEEISRAMVLQVKLQA